MPTIHLEGGFAFRIYPRDHEPAHVHAVGTQGSAKISIEASPRVIRVGRRVRDSDVVRAVRIVQREREVFLQAWRGIHGRTD